MGFPAAAVRAAVLAAAVALASLPPLVALDVSGPHIADLNVLLPPRMTKPVEYRLQGSDGCFSWSWDHHDILSVQPEYNVSSRCSTSARLISIAPYNGRKETAVYATDLHNGITIRCKVFIDKISRIKIFHHAIKINLDELAPLRIRAFDDEENVFSSLVGLQFLWKLVPKSSEDDNSHYLVHVPLKETPLSDCGGFCGDLHTQIELEDRGVGSDLYVVKGIGIGHEVVSAQLLEPKLEHVMDMIVLTVAEAMSLDPPSPVFVTVGALIYYSLRVIRQNAAQVIELPSPHHRWYVTNSSVARVDSMMGIAHALNLGITNIIVEDSRVSGHVQISSFHVVTPDKLCLYMVPVTNASDPLVGAAPIPSSVVWYVFPGQEYIIDIRVFAEGADGNQIHITENNDLKLESDSLRYWDLFSVSKDVAITHNWQNSRLLKPVSPGRGYLTASLTYEKGNSEMAEVLKVVQEVNVCNKVKLIFGEDNEYRQIIHLPWAPGIYQEAQLKATGGCDKTLQDYKWFSSDKATVSISASGAVKAKRPGQVIIRVVSVFDSMNYDEVVIEVSVPSSMVMLPIFPVEVAVGTEMRAVVTLKTSTGVYFHRCDAFSSFVRWKLFSESECFRVIDKTWEARTSDMLPHNEGSKALYGYPCAWTYLYASGAGRAMLHATLSSESLSSFQFLDGPIILKAASPIAAYYPLVAYQAENGNRFGGYWVDLSRIFGGIQDSDSTSLDKLYLVPGSGMDVLLLGGPERWNHGVDFVETVNILGEPNLSVVDGVIVQQASSSGGRQYKILCQALGNYKLLFSRGNLVGADHPMPAIVKVELSVICSFPSSIVLLANEPVNTLDTIEAASNADRGPGRLRTAPVIVSNGCTIRLAAIGIHKTGRAFANSSSLCLRWELSGCEDLAHWSDTKSFERSEATWERFLVLHNVSGLCTVRASVIDFPETMASHLYKKAFSLLEGAEATLTDAIHLQLVSSLQVIPEFVLLFFDPEAKVNLSVTGGTCFLNAVTNDTQVAFIIQPPESTQCSQLIVGARGLGSALVTVRDVGLSAPAAASALVRVADVDWIKIIPEQELSLMVGTTERFDIVAGMHDGCIFDSSQYMYMKIKVHLEDGILELVSENYSPINGEWVVFGPKFSVRALNIGITTLYVSVRQKSGYELLSQLVKVEVYKPLKLHPEYIYLVPGAAYLLTVKGGPKIGASVEYGSMHEGIAVVQKSSGKLSANSIGNATVQAAIYGNGGILICEAYGRVEVGIPSAMTLNLQSDRLCIGCKMPVFPAIPEGDLFSFYEVCRDYKWMVENEKVLSFESAASLHSDVHKASLSCLGNDHPCYSDERDIGFINVLIGRSAGKARVSISVSCDFVLNGYRQPVSYNASESLTVVSDPPLALGIPITWVLPPFYTSSELLPRSSDTYGQVDFHKRKATTTYSMLRACGGNGLLRQAGITIDGSKIRTKESNDLDCIEANDRSTGRTVIASCVRTAEVSQIRVTTPESSFHVAYLPVNAEMELIVSYSDDLGYPFSEAFGVVPLDIETNNPDVISAFMPKVDTGMHGSNEHVTLQAKRPGKALVRISIDHNPRKADFMLVSVGAQLWPRNPVLHVGHYLNFSILGDGLDGLQSGQWLSSNESVLSVNRITGESHASDEGTAEVIFEGMNLKLQTTVTVLKVEQIIVGAPTETLTNIQFPSKGYKFLVKFSDSLDYKFEAPRNQLEVPYNCKVDPPYVGYAKPWSDHVTGNSYCLFFPYSPKSLLSLTSNSNVRLEETTSSGGFIYISIIASLREAPYIMGSAHALFVGGFSIAEVGKVNLTPDSNKSLITVMGNTDVKVNWNAKDLLLVSPLSIVGFGFGGRAEYEVKVLKNQRFTDKITIVLPSTDQTAEIDVSYEPGERSGIREITWPAILVCAAILMLTVIIFMRLLDKPARSAPLRQGAAAASSVAVGPATPERTSAGNVRSSPHTPQRFMEYVRRTVDETPYYKREGRRRFDPQYTY
ncbi:LOW QUALITY PROTEIN: nuclear pore complex protein GP210 [Phoenix dactylifera]|uniref:LOW QUALITY PROTEIN: nuclear pore complex protein GP210 n=1 Tax=Phoenix dactylifera TaxID=42345 RepID=A0A8B7CVG7_PHODC|nr:LOW QUALITY PROTEIN: nuclear pore complex protein GP210 [Phoenix dactylifera]